jgi:lipoate-protein ligase A
MLAWDVVVDSRAWRRDLEAVTRSVCNGIASGLSRLGLSAHFRAPNDIVVGGRKVSGSSGCAEARSAILQGTVLVEDEAAVMARALRLPEAGLRDRVTSLAEALGAAPSLGAILDGLARGLAGSLGRELMPARPGSDETILCESLLRDEIGTDAFVYGPAAAPDRRLAS